MVKDHSDSKRGNLLPPYRLLFPNSGKGSFICAIPRPLLHRLWSTGWNENQYKRKENVFVFIFNNALNLFYLRLYGFGYMVKNHADTTRGNLQPTLHGLLFLISSNESFNYIYHSLCCTSHGILSGRRNSSIVHDKGTI